jgi:hypothetical protein
MEGFAVKQSGLKKSEGEILESAGVKPRIRRKATTFRGG